MIKNATSHPILARACERLNSKQMKQKSIYFIVVLLSITTIVSVSATSVSTLPIKGIESDHQGIIAWNVQGSKVGHAIPAPYNAFGNSYAYYYFATRDKGTFDANAVTGMHGTGVLSGFPKLDSALTANSKTISDINIRMESCNLGNDTKGADWDLVAGVESRKYTGGTYAILLNSDTLLTGAMPQLQLTINYNATNTPYDDQTSGITDYSMPVISATNGVANQVANAFMSDLAGRKIRLNFTSIQPAGQTEYLSGNIFGGFFEIQQGQIETETAIATTQVQVENQNWMHLFPSLVQNELHIQFQKNIIANKISIVNTEGKTLIDKAIISSESIILPVGTLKSGLYFCLITDNNGQVFSQRFIKE